jgi:hypothetical protein
MSKENAASKQQYEFQSASEVIDSFLKEVLADTKLDSATVIAVNQLHKLGKLSKTMLTKRLEEGRKD